ncbi:MAG: SIS domain-containing protein [Opitutales bacterium]
MESQPTAATTPTAHPEPGALQAWIAEYLKIQAELLQQLDSAQIAAAIHLLGQTPAAGGRIFACGNGGSAANASHFANDLGKSAADALLQRDPTQSRFRVLALADNVSWLTAIANDYAYEDVFVRQLENFLQPGDLLIAISVSGNSPNVRRAVDYANQHQAQTLALTGTPGGQLAQSATHTLTIPDNHFGRVEDITMTLHHLLCYAWM